MDALEKRVVDRMQIEGRQLRAEQMTLGRKRVALVKQTAKAEAAVEKMFAALKDGTTPSKAVLDAGAAALKTMAKIARDFEKIHAQMAERADTLARLDDPAERARRVDAAHKLGAVDDGQPVSALDAAEMVLVRRGKATHITDLTGDLLETGVVRLAGKTPAQTISASLSKDAGKPESRFVRVAPNVFDLRTRQATKEPATA